MMQVNDEAGQGQQCRPAASLPRHGAQSSLRVYTGNHVNAQPQCATFMSQGQEHELRTKLATGLHDLSTRPFPTVRC